MRADIKIISALLDKVFRLLLCKLCLVSNSPSLLVLPRAPRPVVVASTQLRHFEMTSRSKHGAIYWCSSVYGQMNANFTSFYIIMRRTILYRVVLPYARGIYISVLANLLDTACLSICAPLSDVIIY